MQNQALDTKGHSGCVPTYPLRLQVQETGKGEAVKEGFLEELRFKLGLEGPAEYVDWSKGVCILEMAEM